MDLYRQTYIEEARENLEELTQALLELETDPCNNEHVDKAFRALHTIKGSGSMFGFDTIAAFTHTIETVYDLVREGRLSVTPELISHTLAASDVIRDLLQDNAAIPAGKDELELIFRNIAASVQGATTGNDEPPSPQPDDTAPEENDRNDETTYRIVFKPAHDLLLNGTNPLLLLRELQDMGTCTITTVTDNVPEFENLNPEMCYVHWDIILTTLADRNTILDVFIFVEDGSTITVDIVDTVDHDTGEEKTKKIGEILTERGDVSTDDIQEAIGEQKRIGEVLIAAGKTTEQNVNTALAEQQHLQTVQQQKAQEKSASSIRVASPKIDTLVDLVGELVTFQAGLSQFATVRMNPDTFKDEKTDRHALMKRCNELMRIAESAERLTAELRDTTMSIRMIPVGTLFNKFRRVVRDLSRSMGKTIDFIIEGGETELDKTVIEKLSDPLMHIIRNCIDHGIELPDVRTAAGKQANGTVKLSARHSGAYVVITVQDDGAGLNRNRIRQKALEKGIIDENVELDEKAVYDLIFAPGFSTAGEVTDVSGRGVGMDVVRRNIVDNLQGAIDIGSESGRGTTLTLKMPLSLAIIDSLLVKVENNPLILPLGVVEECVELTADDRKRQHGKHMAQIRGHLVPYIALREYLYESDGRPGIEQVVVCNINGNKTGVVVDEVLGKHQAVIKPLGKMYKDIQGVSGASILGDGTVALILDTQQLVHAGEATA